MTDNFIRIWYLFRKLTNKYEKALKENPQCEKAKRTWNQLMQLYYSYGVVYPDWNDWENQLLKARKARKARKNRIAKYLKGMFLSYDADKLYFLTISFHDDAFKATAKTRHTNVQRWLNINTLDYMANLDYGSKKKREHYHAVVASSVQFSETSIPYAHIHFERIYSRNPKRLAKYLSKLTNHAQKLTCGKAFHKRGLVDVDSLPF